eukprot:2649150-Pyramimonas_sp.AAC.1
MTAAEPQPALAPAVTAATVLSCASGRSARPATPAPCPAEGGSPVATRAVARLPAARLSMATRLRLAARACRR